MMKLSLVLHDIQKVMYLNWLVNVTQEEQKKGVETAAESLKISM